MIQGWSASVSSFKIGVKGPAKVQVDELHTKADPKHGSPCVREGVEQLSFPFNSNRRFRVLALFSCGLGGWSCQGRQCLGKVSASRKNQPFAKGESALNRRIGGE